MHLDHRTQAYLVHAANVLGETLGGDLFAVWNSGSIALGDYHPLRSDIDLMVVVETCPSEDKLQSLAGRLHHARLPCPAIGLDLVGYRERSARTPSQTPRAEFGWVTGAAWESQLTGSEVNADFLIDLAVCHGRGWSLFGPSPSDVIGSIPADWLWDAVCRVIWWHRTKIHDAFHDPTGASAVLNACRAWQFSVEGLFVSKTAAGEWALDQWPTQPMISQALTIRRGERTLPLDRQAVLTFLERVIDAVRGGTATSST